MYGMFAGSSFNNDISRWDVSSVDTMSYMFEGGVFNGDISSWDLPEDTRITDMFQYGRFSGQLPEGLTWHRMRATRISHIS
jgi:hypothetical protein